MERYRTNDHESTFRQSVLKLMCLPIRHVSVYDNKCYLCLRTGSKASTGPNCISTCQDGRQLAKALRGAGRLTAEVTPFPAVALSPSFTSLLVPFPLCSADNTSRREIYTVAETQWLDEQRNDTPGVFSSCMQV